MEWLNWQTIKLYIYLGYLGNNNNNYIDHFQVHGQKKDNKKDWDIKKYYKFFVTNNLVNYFIRLDIFIIRYLDI